MKMMDDRQLTIFVPTARNNLRDKATFRAGREQVLWETITRQGCDKIRQLRIMGTPGKGWGCYQEVLSDKQLNRGKHFFKVGIG